MQVQSNQKFAFDAKETREIFEAGLKAIAKKTFGKKGTSLNIEFDAGFANEDGHPECLPTATVSVENEAETGGIVVTGAGHRLTLNADEDRADRDDQNSGGE